MRNFTLAFICFFILVGAQGLAQNQSSTGARGEFDLDSYIVKPGDKLEIYVNALPELENLYEVRVDGGIFHPITGQMQVSGHTLSDVRSDFQTRLRRELHRPNFRLGLQKISLHQVAVLGEAQRQGTFEVGVGSTALDLLARAGGLGEKADKDLATILRGDEQIEIKLEPVAGHGLTKLRPGDVLFIRAGTQVSVAGEVAEPGPYTVSKLTGSPWEAIISAGGSKPEAALSRVKILRPTVADPIIVNLRPDSPEPIPDEAKVLQQGDVIVVPARQAVVLGSVTKPGPVPLTKSMNLIEVLSEKLGRDSNVKQVYVVRSEDVFKNRDKKEVYDLESFFKEGEARSAAVPIHDGDLVFVPAKGQKNGLLTGGGLTRIFGILNIARLLF